MTTGELLRRAREARTALGLAGTETKNAALRAMADELERAAEAILEANALDMEAARGPVSDVMLDRLALDRDGSAAWPRASGPRRTCRIRWAGCCAGQSGPVGW